VKDIHKLWVTRQPTQETITALQQSLGTSPLVSRILAGRGISNYEEAYDFFTPKLEDLHDPMLMKDMDKALLRLDRAFRNGERILVFGDYDVDGTTSVACMYRFLCSIYDPSRIDYYIPNRYREGYGISREGIRFAKENDFSLVIALDCGIKSTTLISEALAEGISFIICDHHIPDEVLPPAAAILNPKQSDCRYPFKELCGCGVGYKLISAICGMMGLPADTPYEYLDLVATAIAADIVPITGENRTLAYFGLKRVNTAPCVGMAALLELNRTGRQLTVTDLIFMIAPRVNAAGRMDDARKAVRLFIETDFLRALSLASQLQDDNSERKETDGQMTAEALSMMQSDAAQSNKKSTVLFQPHWHKGVVGIVASRMMDLYYRPTVILSQNGDIVSGSARSVQGFNIHDGLEQCSDLLIGFGGHYFAAGMTMPLQNVQAFTERFEAVVKASSNNISFTQEITIDAIVSFAELTSKFYRTLCRMEPFGPENPAPVFMATNIKDDGGSRIVKEKHLRISVIQDGLHFSGIGFNLGRKMPLFENGAAVDIAFTLDENDWKNQKTLQLRVLDLRPAIH
jgi:single-stranded-DNA-specific exonuclease